MLLLMLKDSWNVLGCLKVNSNPSAQVCDPSAPLRTGCHASLKCRHERGTLKRAWQVKMNSESIVWLIKKKNLPSDLWLKNINCCVD